MKPPVLAVPISGKSFLIYVRAMDHTLGALLAQTNEPGHEQTIYYLNKTIVEAEHQYTLVENECLALVFVVHKFDTT